MNIKRAELGFMLLNINSKPLDFPYMGLIVDYRDFKMWPWLRPFKVTQGQMWSSSLDSPYMVHI